jgi:hypothetical protein
LAFENRNNPVLDKLARALLASTCLAGAVGVARADSIIYEGAAPAPLQFPTTSPGYLLPVGTFAVAGGVMECECEGSEDTNWFEFQGLLPGSHFTISNSTEASGGFSVYSTTPSLLTGCGFEGCSTSGAVPQDGDLVIATFTECSECGVQQYEIELDAPLDGAPEPSTLATAGLALAGALVWRRRRSRVG